MSYKELLQGFLLLALAIVFLGQAAFAQEKATGALYFTGVGCTHCAKSDPVVLGSFLEENPQLIVFEYEIYQQGTANAPVFSKYADFYGFRPGVPALLFGDGSVFLGDRNITNIESSQLRLQAEEKVPLFNGDRKEIANLKSSDLPGLVKIWSKDRVLIRKSFEKSSSDRVPLELLSGDINVVLDAYNYKEVIPTPIALSGASVQFGKAVQVDGWVFQWDRKDFGSISFGDSTEDMVKSFAGEVQGEFVEDQDPGGSLTLAKIASLGAADAVNPCALAVLTLVLVTILTRNPKNRKAVLWAGLAFTTSVFVMYLFYGLIIIRFFKLVSALTNIRLLLYKILGGVAIFLGILQIKDFVDYSPGSFGTEMPLGLRSKVKELVDRLTSPAGAFGVGAFVTVFLLPCTVGPYIICGGILSTLDFVQALPWMLLYNFIFVLPMILITLVCYKGFATVEDVSGWKDRNIRYLHLVAGILIFALGLAMVFGWI
ncbi:MAG: hypothetical protein U9M98_02850 [Patescibacteria group bacterium]|nr:hypothetical protein [Patescibacteria group bacterium]